MSAICTSTLLRCLIDLDMLDDKIAGIESLAIRIGFGVTEKRQRGTERI